jgi:DNA invertase Pin-like site-specific DNA recombinase
MRVSTEQQKLEGQKEKVISAAISDGYQLEEIAVVEGKESARKLEEEERETLNEMKRFIAQYPTIESVYVFAIDRLARKVSIVLSVKDYLLKNNINLVFLNPHKMSTMRKEKRLKMN